MNKEMTERFENLGETLNTIMADNNKFRDEMVELQNKVIELENKNEGLELKCNELETENNRLKCTIVSTQIMANEAEQNSRKYCLTFHNIEFSDNVKIDHFTCMDKIIETVKAMEILQQPLEYADFAACHLIPSKQKTNDSMDTQSKNGSPIDPPKGKSIIAKFVNAHCAEMIFFNRKKCREFEDDTRRRIGVAKGKNVHVSPNLTDLNRKLFKQAFELKNQKYWKFIWADCRGTIKVRKSETSEIKIIKCTEDIHNCVDNLECKLELDCSILC